MARIRTIKPTFWADEKIATLPRPIRLTFLGIISAMSDDYGRCRANARLVCAAVYPLDEDVTTAEICVHLDMLAETGLIGLYEVAGEKYLYIINWSKHQKINRPSDSQLPAPPRKKAPASNQPQREPSVTAHGKLSEDSVSPQPVVEGSVVESNGKDILASGEAVNSSANGKHLTSWPVEGSRIWAEGVGPIDTGRFGKAMKPMVDKYGWPTSKAALLCYIELNEGKTRRVEWLVGDAVRWVGLGQQPMTDGTGTLTERGKLAQQLAMRLS